MTAVLGEDGCPAFVASVALDLADSDRTFAWGVVLDGPQGANFWGIPTEIQDATSTDRVRTFRLTDPADGQQTERYYLTFGRYLGANKHTGADGVTPDLRFAVWAPNALDVEVVFGLATSGYIADTGAGIDPARPPLPMQRQPSGVWLSAPLADFSAQAGAPYLYRITSAQNASLVRTDIFARQQIGRGAIDPSTQPWPGTLDTLDGTLSCSVVVDPDTVAASFIQQPGVAPVRISQEDFWAHEFTPGLSVPTAVENLVIYELHVGSLGFGNPDPGTLADAIAFLDHLVDLGVNAVELLPLSQFDGVASWGYGRLAPLRHSSQRRWPGRVPATSSASATAADRPSSRTSSTTTTTRKPRGRSGTTTPPRPSKTSITGTKVALPSIRSRMAATSTTAPAAGRRATGRKSFASSSSAARPCWSKRCHVDGLRVDLTQAMHRDNQLATPTDAGRAAPTCSVRSCCASGAGRCA